MAEPGAPTRVSWLRWALAALLLLVGVVMFLALASGSVPLVQLGADTGFR